jgi:hypothetical protein
MTILVRKAEATLEESSSEVRRASCDGRRRHNTNGFVRRKTTPEANMRHGTIFYRYCTGQDSGSSAARKQNTNRHVRNPGLREKV